MNGIHDMGGMHGFGPVVRERDEPPFHAAWEGRLYAAYRALTYAGAVQIDRFRYAQERLPAEYYLRASYYERWLSAAELMLLEKGVVGTDELSAGRSLRPAVPAPGRVMRMEDVNYAFARGSFGRPVVREALFASGDRVRARNIHPWGHTRLPRYVRSRVGIVEAVRGFHTYADSIASGAGEDPQWLYTVVFDGQELWGCDTEPGVSISVDAFEPYLERC